MVGVLSILITILSLISIFVLAQSFPSAYNQNGNSQGVIVIVLHKFEDFLLLWNLGF